MTGCIRKGRAINMKRGREAGLAVLFAAALSNCLVFAGDRGLVRHAVEAKGDWERGIVLKRAVLLTDKNSASAAIDFEVPVEGDYQLYAYVYHNWRKYTPFISFEARDSAGDTHSGYMFFEPIWYLDKELPGRWVMHSPNAMPFWHLPEGRLSLRFRATGRDSMWDQDDSGMEGIIALETLILVPVSDGFSASSMDPEFLQGGAQDMIYSEDHGTGIAVVSENKVSYREIRLPVSGNYMALFSLYSRGPYKLEVSFSKGGVDRDFIIEDQAASSLWRNAVSGQFYIEAGDYTVGLRDISGSAAGNGMAVDYFILMPLPKEAHGELE